MVEARSCELLGVLDVGDFLDKLGTFWENKGVVLAEVRNVHVEVVLGGWVVGSDFICLWSEGSEEKVSGMEARCNFNAVGDAEV